MAYNRNEWLREIGSRLKELRKRFEYNREKMSAYLGLSDNGLGKNEGGHTFPGNLTLHRLKEHFGVSMDWLLFGGGPVFFEEKKTVQEWEKEIGALKDQLEQARREKEAAVEELAQSNLAVGAGDGVELSDEMKKMIRDMIRVPLLRYELLAGYQRFLRDEKNRDAVK
ncbi:MAG: hypothetical protein GY940_45250 [bacterium]|nr:hypothetical protein [bacterium]